MHFIGSAPLESLSLWERWHCEAMTERASSFPFYSFAVFSSSSALCMVPHRSFSTQILA